MECKECGAKIKEGVVFCGICGTKVEESPKTCNSCGEIVNENAKFCRKCGESTEEMITQDTTIEEVVEAVTDEETTEEAVNEEVAATVIEPVQEITEKPTPKSAIGQKMTNVILSVAIIAVLILVVTTFGGKAIKPANKKAQLMIFQKDYEDIYGKYVGKTEYILKSSDISQTIINKDGKKIYSIDEDKNLYIQEGNKSAEKIASDVDWIKITPSGNTIAYMKETDDYDGTGELYVKSGTKEPEKIASEGCLLYSVTISENGKYVAYTEIVDGDMDDAKTYLYPVGGTKDRAGRYISIAVSNKGHILAANTDNDIYMIKKGKEAEKVASESKEIVANKDFSQLLILDYSGTLYSYKGKDREKVEGNIDWIAGVKGLEDYNMHQNGNFVYSSTKELDIMVSKNDSIYIILDGKEAVKVTNSSTTDYRITEDYKEFVYVSNEKLYMKKFKNKKLKEEIDIDSKVSVLSVSPDGSKIAYIKEGDLYYLGTGNKTGTKVEAKDDVTDMEILDNGTIYYETQDDRLFVTKGKKAGDKISDDISDWDVTDKAVYILDSDDRLFEAIGTKKPVKVSDDVTAIYNLNYARYSTNMY